MLKQLEILTKISKQALDEKRKFLAALLDKKDNFLNVIKALDKNLIAEQNFATTTSDVSYKIAFPNFAMLIRDKQKQLYDEIQKLEPEINKAADEVAEHFSEMKKYELVRERKIEEINQEIQRKTQLEIDEIAIMKFALQVV